MSQKALENTNEMCLKKKLSHLITTFHVFFFVFVF